ncbi:four-helix bundle copper-binding protein [Hymenobacter sp. 102]|uniref:four-helix bundle copper-binding protein n=1 Tax=Hymenobacter sp. 102 TaxID=3403152 RepID=UPI003CED5DA7
MHTQNQSLLDALNACIAACEHCATACLQEDNVKMMARCVLLDRDCADICALTARFTARGSEHAAHLLRECAEICKACADECEKHGAHPSTAASAPRPAAAASRPAARALLLKYPRYHGKPARRVRAGFFVGPGVLIMLVRGLILYAGPGRHPYFCGVLHPPQLPR